MDEDEQRKIYADYMLQDAADRLRYQQEFTVEGFKTLVLINGGAMIGLLTYIGNSGRSANGLFLSFGAYAFGLALATLAYLFAYHSQSEFMTHAAHHGYKALGLKVEGEVDGNEKRGNRAILIAKGLVVVALLCFIGGSVAAMFALR